MKKLILLPLVLGLVAGCSSELDSSSDSGDQPGLMDFSNVPQGYSKAASSQQIAHTKEIADVLQTINNRLSLGLPTQVADVQNLPVEHPEDVKSSLDIGGEVSMMFRNCSLIKDTDDSIRDVVSVSAKFEESDNCFYQLDMSYVARRATLGERGGPVAGEKELSLVIRYKGISQKNFKGMNLSFYSNDLTMISKDRRPATREMSSTAAGGNLDTSNGNIVFGLKKAHSSIIQKKSDRKTMNVRTSPFKAGFIIQGEVVLYEVDDEFNSEVKGKVQKPRTRINGVPQD